MKLLNLHFVLAASALMLLFGCSSQPKPESVIPKTDLASQSVDEQFVAVAKVFPGFAGLFYKDDGGLVLNVAPPPGSSARASFMLTDALEDEVLTAALDLLSDDLLILGYISRTMVEEAMPSEANLADLVGVHRVEYDYLSLASWYDKPVIQGNIKHSTKLPA